MPKGYNARMKTARQRILEYIQANKAVTSAELRLALKTTEANVRRHLSILLEQGLIEVIGERSPQGKGRPARIFGPSAQMTGSNLGLLAAALFEEVLPALSPEEKRDFLERLARRIEADMPGRDESAQAIGNATVRSERLTARLYAAVQRLNAAHYQARWEARADGPRMVLGHCPFAAINQKHPEICQVDAHVLEILTGGSAEQIKRLAKDSRGAVYCMFRILPTT
jgi:predicted ArsR family transcriptional regulator